ncbi:hypothetical protein WUBG_13587, partial [Wuchereria bancrofti]
MWKLLRIKDIKIDKDREVRNVQVETLTGKFLGRPINILYPLEVNGGENHPKLNNKEGMKVLETEQKTGELQEYIAIRARSNKKRQSQSKGNFGPTTSTPSTETYEILYNRRQMDGSKLTQISHNKWTTTDQVRYSYGWLGVKCQATTNLVLTEREIFLYDGKGENQQTIDPILKPPETSKIWDELNQLGEELSEQLEGEFEKTT